MNLQVPTSISCHPVEILTHWLGRQVIQLLLKISRINDLEKLPHTMSLTHWHTYHFALFYDCIHAHDNKRYHLWSVFSCFFSHYHSSWLLLLQWWWVQLLCVPLRMVNFELWPGETWTVKGETLSSHVISVIQLGWQLWCLDSKNRQNKIIWDFVIYKTEGTHYKS